MSGFPLIAPYRAQAPLIFDGRAWPQAGFLAQAAVLAQALPPARCVLNLCESRAAFMLGFAAALMRGQVSLLPPDKSAGTIAALRRQYADCPVLSDLPLPQSMHVPARLDGRDWHGAVPAIAAEQVAVLAFTSGSTGAPVAHAKTWGQLHRHARLLCERLGAAGACVVATVPPQHVFGLETSVMSALAGAAVSSAARPFFAQDIARELALAPAPRLLVTTPLHLDVLLRAALPLPPIEGVVSATAPLSAALAAAAERQLQAPVHEVYGTTETGGLATRRTAAGECWLPLPEVSVSPAADGAMAAAPFLPGPVPLADLVEPAGDGRFRLLGRRGDLLKVAGKRMSLADLSLKLRAIPGVEDAVAYLPAAPDGASLVQRPAALVVAPDLDEQQILHALSAAVDPVFLPRPLRRVPRLPRNELGKLPRAALDRLLKE